MDEKITLQLRLPAEWETVGAIMIAWPHAETDWAYMLEEIERCYVNMVEAFIEDSRVIILAPNIERPKQKLAHLDENKLIFCQIATNDTWTRDYGPITVETPQGLVGCDFKFNGWGLKFAANYDNLATQSLYQQRVLTGLYMNCLNFVLEGGSIESDGKGTLMTTAECLLSPNRNGASDRPEIEECLSQTLGAKRFLWIENGYLDGDDTDSHVDTLARFAPDDTIVYVGCDDEKDEHYHALKAMEEDIKGFVTEDGRRYRLIRLPLPDAVFDNDGQRLPATYANFLVTPRTVFMPVYQQEEKDKMAEAMLRQAFPNHKIVKINCLALIQQHGSLHCATMQIPNEIINI